MRLGFSRFGASAGRRLPISRYFCYQIYSCALNADAGLVAIFLLRILRGGQEGALTRGAIAPLQRARFTVLVRISCIPVARNLLYPMHYGQRI